MKTLYFSFVVFLFSCHYVDAQGLVSSLEPYWAENQLNVNRSSRITRVPFDLEQGILFVEARLNGQEGTFILDTGAPTLIVNGKYSGSGDQAMLTVTEACQAREVTFDRFSWAGMELSGVEALMMDLSHLEKTYQRDLLGVIGYQMFADREILIDTRKKEIFIFHDDQPTTASFGTPLRVIPFSLQHHIPVIRVQVGNSTLKLGFDSGCSINLIEKSAFEALPDFTYEAFSERNLQGFSPRSQRAEVILLDHLRIADLDVGEMEFLVADFSHLKEADVHIQGLLGFPFIQNSAFSINFRRMEITFWETGPSFSGVLR